MRVAIYLAGGIQKGHEKGGFYWTEAELRELRRDLARWDISFLNPALRTDDLSDSRSVFGRDMVQVFSSQVVLVDAREKRGLGVGAEMMWAKINRIPVIAWAPKNSHYRKDETTLLGVRVEQFVHPFVDSLSDALVESLEEASHWIRMHFSSHPQPVKGIEEIGAAMEHYKTTQFHRDKPMSEIIHSNQTLEMRMRRSLPKLEAAP